MEKDIKIAVIGLGYVGLPLFCLISKHFTCIGLDNDFSRINLLKEGIDNRECEKRRNIIFALQRGVFTSLYSDIKDSNIYIVCVQTGVDESNKPDLTPIKKVCKSLSKILKRGDTVIFESTVFPGAIEDICIPILEEYSSMKVNTDFSVGYSPERINVGDKSHKLALIPKIISASNKETLSLMDNIYSTILSAPIIQASSIKVAEAAKMYENVQRDVLIALANEFSSFCDVERININEVTECAASKWNFAKVYPGLVGGHCIGVDTYYLLQRAKEKKQQLNLIQTARNVNEEKSHVVANKIKDIAISVEAHNILLLGFSYKADTPDYRNTKVFDIYNELKEDFTVVDCFDPIVNKKNVKNDFGISIITLAEACSLDYDLVVKLVDHKAFKKIEFPQNKFIDINEIL